MSSYRFKIAIILIVMATAGRSADLDQDILTLIAKERYNEAVILAERAAGSDEFSPSVKATILLTMARFYEFDVGAYDRAIEYYERLCNLPIPEDASIRREADAALDRLRCQHQTFADVYGILDNIGRLSATRDKAATAIRDLDLLLKENPDFPEPETIRYYLGLYCYLDEQYSRAYGTLNAAFAQRPAVEVKLPNLPRLRQQAKQKWAEAFTHDLAWSILGGFILVTTAVFFVSKPWRWIALRHWIIILGLFVAWYGVFTFAGKRIGAHAQEMVANTPGEITSKFSTFGNPAEKAFKALFHYGLLGTLGVAVFAVATARLRPRWSIVVLNGVVAFLLFSSLMVVFYERYGRQGRTHLSIKNPSVFDRLKTVILYTTDEIEPFLLTNPTAFPNINIMTIHDPAVREWFVPYLVNMSMSGSPQAENLPSGDGNK